MHTANTSATIPFIPVLKSGSSLLSFSGSYVDICEMLYLTEQMHRHMSCTLIIVWISLELAPVIKMQLRM